MNSRGEVQYMTEVELSNAKFKYETLKAGKRLMLESLKNEEMHQFASVYFSNVNKEKIQSIHNDEILRYTFLSTFRDTKESSRLMIWLNYVERVDGILCDDQPILSSINWDSKWLIKKRKELNLFKENEMLLLKTPGRLNIYNLYCDLETNKPFLVRDIDESEFFRTSHAMFIPCNPISEMYTYNSHSLDQITKGTLTKAFNRLQLYYFRLLLNNSKDNSLTRMKKLTSKDLEEICFKR